MSRKITKVELLKTGHGTHYFEIEYEGDWLDEELITAVDNKAYDNPTAQELIPNHFGGTVQRYEEENKKGAIVAVYYD